ncbi:Rieske 2Fe-2S domain-containing protein [uncultured Thalassospira sp.]|uniref:Rieske (2Fe-2S) protein n=1 Tax=uncultured Thalassospira sp. TaxID=404382 RepID=UPI002582F784|nr:Rieske 2Fe-2S domain-containing protein [uncultured Thalassospira sp.]
MINICKSSEIPEGEMIKKEVSGLGFYALARHEGQIFVFPDKCPHAEESLTEQGWLEDGRVICGVHFAEFELETGEVHNRPIGCPNLSFFTCEDRNGDVFALINEEN